MPSSKIGMRSREGGGGLGTFDSLLLVTLAVCSTCGPVSPYSGRDCENSLRSSYTGLENRFRDVGLKINAKIEARLSYLWRIRWMADLPVAAAELDGPLSVSLAFLCQKLL